MDTSRVQPIKLARVGHQSAGPDRLSGAVHSGACGVHGRHQPLHHPQREGAGARGRRSHPAGVGARGPAAALSWARAPLPDRPSGDGAWRSSFGRGAPVGRSVPAGSLQ